MHSSTDQVVVLCWETPTANDKNARKIAEFLGAEVASVPLAVGVREADAIRRKIPICSAIIVHAETLVQMAEVVGAGLEGLLTLTDLAPHLFVYGLEPTDRHSSLLRTLSSGVLLGLEGLPSSNATFEISSDQREWLGPFSGLSVRGADATRDGCFIEGETQPRKTVLVRVADRPFLVCVDRGKSTVFFAACREMADVGEKVPGETGLVPWFSRLVPLMVFLKIALGNRLWHSARNQACFIIDDPLLKHRYGFLEYRKLLESMARQKFSASFAFIPWNYRRSSKEIVDLFSADPVLSLCVHGCDHTGAEFAETSVEPLRDKARLALERMTAHGELFGLPFDEVMIFPQGLFSSAALEALDGCGYLAAVNTTLCPSDAPQCLTLEDLLSVAVTRFGGAPLFARHYPGDVAEFAFDLFVGKPALVVEHHGYFRNGYSEIETFVRQLNELDAHLEWSSLATICSRACLKRVTPDGTVHARFYTYRFRCVNHGDQSTTYVFSLPWAPDKPLPDVTLNGKEWLRERRGDSLRASVSLDPDQAVDVRILPGSANGVGRYWKPTKTYKAKVLIRRVLSEFRDDHVDTSTVLAGLVSRARKLRPRGQARGAATT